VERPGAKAPAAFLCRSAVSAAFYAFAGFCWRPRERIFPLRRKARKTNPIFSNYLKKIAAIMWIEGNLLP
jgi:hypothetical protein